MYELIAYIPDFQSVMKILDNPIIVCTFAALFEKSVLNNIITIYANDQSAG